jgi:hypothetical protein
MNPIDIQVNHHRETLDKQKLNKVVQHPNFVVAWERAPYHERLLAKYLIDTYDAKELASWIRRFNFGNLRAFTTKELRQQASNHHVAGYSRLTKNELIESLEGIIDG